MPFETTSVVHPDWAEHHAPVSEGSMNADVTIRTYTTPDPDDEWNPETGPTDPSVPGTVTYTGRARITYEVVRGYGDRDAVGQDVTTRVVTVALPRDTTEQPAKARVTVTAVGRNGPAELVGRVLTVDSTGWSSHGIERLLTCRDDQTNQPGGA